MIPTGAIRKKTAHLKNRIIAAGFTGFCLFSIIVALSTQPIHPARDLVYSMLNQSGVENPVTAVLLNFRGVDTLLELVAIYVVLVTVSALSFNRLDSIRCVHSDTVLRGLTNIVAPVTFVIAIYLLYNGTRLPGGAFQAGALLAALLGLIAFSGHHHLAQERVLSRIGMVSGLVVFSLTGLSVYSDAQSFLTYPPVYATSLILTIEIVATVSIALTLGRYISALPQSQVSL